MAADKHRLELAWVSANKGAVTRLPFAYLLTPMAKVPQFIHNRAAWMLGYCRRTLDLEPARIYWLEWALKEKRSRTLLLLAERPLYGLALTGPRTEPRPGGTLIWKNGAALDALGEAILVRWDLPIREMLHTVAHEAKHLWYSINDPGLDSAQEEAACERFAQESLEKLYKE